MFYPFCCIIRPRNDGKWFVQNDVDHTPQNTQLVVLQSDKDLHVCLANQPGGAYTHVGVASVTVDDGFFESGIEAAAGGAGLDKIRITLRKNKIVDGVLTRPLLNPGLILNEMCDPSNGNLWVHGWMFRP